MNRKRPQKPMYLDRQPADHRRMMYSTPKNTTRQISIQKSVSLAKSWYWSMVDRTLNIKQTNTSINLQVQRHYTSHVSRVPKLTASLS